MLEKINILHKIVLSLSLWGGGGGGGGQYFPQNWAVTKSVEQISILFYTKLCSHWVWKTKISILHKIMLSLNLEKISILHKIVLSLSLWGEKISILQKLCSQWNFILFYFTQNCAVTVTLSQWDPSRFLLSTDCLKCAGICTISLFCLLFSFR